MQTENAQPGRRNGIALLLAAGLIAALIAVVFAFVPGIGAHPCDPDLTTDMHQDTGGLACGDAGHASAISSDEPGAAVSIELHARAEGGMNAGDTITVDFSGFNLPTSITNPARATATNPNRVTINPGDIAPEEIVRQGSRVTLTIPGGETVAAGSYTINFHERANIRNPYYSGSYDIIVTSSLSGDEPDVSTVTIRRITRIRPPFPIEGPRGTQFRLEGMGYPEGTVTIFDGDDNTIDDGEFLDTVNTLRGAFTSTLLEARGRSGSLTYDVWVRDSEGGDEKVTFSLTSSMSFEPTTARVDDMVTITITDWRFEDKGVGAVYFAGQRAYIAGVTEYDDCYEYTRLQNADDDNVVSFEVTVPGLVPPGQQTVSVYDQDQLSFTLENTGNPLCTDSNAKANPREVEARLKDNPMPVIRETIEIVSELPEPTRRVNIFEVDGGLDQELEFEANPPATDPDSYFDEGDQIEISLPGFDLSGAVFNSREQRELIRISGSLDDTHVTPVGVVPDDTNEKLILTLPGSAPHGAGEHLIITIGQGTGILTPEIPRGFDDPDEGYPVTITFVDAGSAGPGVDADDENIVVVKNPISSTVPNAAVRVELVAYAEAEIGSSEEIVVDFSGPSADSEFSVPASISNTRVSIRSGGRTFNPSEVQVQGARVILTIPSGTSARTVVPGEFTIIFSNLARIRNPFTAGVRDIKVSSFVQGDLEDVIKAVIRRTTTIDTLEGPRGTEFILEGKGYARGTVTVYHDANDNQRIDAGETLASAATVRGAFSVDLIARGKRGDPVYGIRTRDSEGVEDEVVFRIRSGMFIRPTPARVGSPLRITISDWEEEDIAAVSVAGETAYVTGVEEYERCFEYPGLFKANSEGVIDLEIDVPRNVPGGNQTVAVYDHEQLEHIDGDGNVIPDKGACADLPNPDDRGNPVRSNVMARLKSEPAAAIKETIEIDTEDLTLSPDTAARGQEVTVTGSGFSRAARAGDHFASVSIGGIRVVEDHSGMEVGSAGEFAFTVTVPLDIADGRHDVLIEGSDGTLGRATLTVTEATITLDPPQGQRGTDFKVTGRGFIAREVVILTYGPERSPYGEDIALADAQGNFELTFTVPLSARVGNSHQVRAVADPDGAGAAGTITAEASHLIPGAAVTTAPSPVSPGERLTIRAQGLPPFTQVGRITIQGIGVFDNSGVATDENGSFEAKVLVPNIEFGDKTLLIQVAEVIVPHIIKVAPPPLSGTPNQVFKYLIRDGVLLTVWRYDNATQSWGLFDPLFSGELAMLNDLTEVGSGDVVWLNLSKPQSFQGSDLAEGWNLISLK